MPMKKGAPATAPAQPTALTIDLTPSADAQAAVALRTEAAGLVVIDRDSHARALEFIRGSKQLLRKIEEHWTRITRNVDDLKKNLLTLKRQDCAPVEEAIRLATDVALTYENAEKRRVQEEQDRVRREAEAKAQADRQAEQARLEAEALQAEAQSPDLSARERVFVDAIIRGHGPIDAAVLARYADPEKQAGRLTAMPKIIAALDAAKRAAVIREQATAKAAQPVEVVVPRVESQLGKAAGVSTRKSYSAAVDDLPTFLQAIKDGRIPLDYVLPHQVALNQIAEKAPALFEQAFPGCRLVTKQTIAG